MAMPLDKENTLLKARAWVWVLIILAAIILASTVVVIFAITQRPPDTNIVSMDEDDSAEASRGYKLGIAGFTPPNFPDFDAADVSAFWNDINQYTDTYGVHVDWQELGLLDISLESYDGTLLVVLGWQNPSDWRNKTGELRGVVDKYLSSSGDIKYIGIGNEINILSEKYPNKFKDFVSSYKEIYEHIKDNYPGVVVFPTWHYESLMGKGYLMGRKSGMDAWEVFEDMEEIIDAVALTTYPYFDYKTPGEVPDDYFSRIRKRSDKPMIITETGWMSREKYGGKLANLNKQGYTGSEEEQLKYLKRLIEIVDPKDFEVVNWAFLHDIYSWEEGDNPEGEAFLIFDSIGLKNNDGSSKEAWSHWKTLF